MIHPDHAAFDAAALDVANELAFGMHPKYNHGNGCVCAVGLIKEKMGIPSEEAHESSNFIAKVTGRAAGAYTWGDPGETALHRLYHTRNPDANKDQYEGSKRIFEYLDARKLELEEVS